MKPKLFQHYTPIISRLYLFIFLFIFNIASIQAQHIPDSILKKPWKARWIAAKENNTSPQGPDGGPKFGVYKFRKSFNLTSQPDSFVIHVSADNRYKLYVNERLVSLGPARGDLYNWNFETVNIAPYLQPGKNTVAALVWNFSDWRPEAQITYRTGFILQGRSATEDILNTDTSWKVIRDSSYILMRNIIPAYYVSGPGELIQMQKHISSWEKNSYNDSAWKQAQPIAAGLTKETSIDATGWMLVPSIIPQMELTQQRLASLRKVDGVAVSANFPLVKTSVTIPANTKATLLLDQGHLTNAYPTLIFSGGKSAGISLHYAEALFIRVMDTSAGSSAPPKFRLDGKGNRNEVEGKYFLGTKDSLLSDGSKDQNFTPLWWRTFRYIQLTIDTKEDPLVIEDIYSHFTGYPFQYNAKFESNDAQLEQMLQIGWRTARLCAFETYMDCPYYEQLQYIGDARIQALVSLFNSGDDKLMRNALNQMDQSRIAEGITLSRWPSFTHQQIPTFSLWYIGMLHDYFMYRPDSHFVKEKLPGMRQVLNWFSRYQDAEGALKEVPYWIFTDWITKKGWARGMAPIGKKGESAVLDMQLMWTYQLAAELEAAMGVKELSAQYKAKAAQLKKTIQKRYWDASKNLYADTESKDLFSQHTNSLAILSGLIKGDKATALAKKMLSDTTLTETSIYFKYYLHQALTKAGLGNEYLNWLDIWKENIKLGLTTWAEMSDVSRSRSDCHAWGSSPNIEFFRTVLGIDTDAPGFRKILITPHLGSLTKAGGTIPHPSGPLTVQYVQENNKWKIAIQLPPKTTGTLRWLGKEVALKAGKNYFQW